VIDSYDDQWHAGCCVSSARDAESIKPGARDAESMEGSARNTEPMEVLARTAEPMEYLARLSAEPRREDKLGRHSLL
jgi:hypothetical protein